MGQGQHWGLQALAAPSCLAHAGPWHREQHWQHPVRLHPAPHPYGCSWGLRPRGSGGQPGIGASGREEFVPTALATGPCPMASSPARYIPPVHPFPTGHHGGASNSQGHQNPKGSTAVAILLCLPAIPSTL